MIELFFFFSNSVPDIDLRHFDTNAYAFIDDCLDSLALLFCFYDTFKFSALECKSIFSKLNPRPLNPFNIFASLKDRCPFVFSN